MDTNLHIRLNKELKESFQEIAKGNNTDPSSLVRDWIGNYVAEHRKTDEDSAAELYLAGFQLRKHLEEGIMSPRNSLNNCRSIP